MPSRPPEGPLHLDEDLIRFHNGDTLDNIPVVRNPRPRRFTGKDIALAGIIVLVGAASGALLALHPSGRSSDGAPGDQRPETSLKSSAAAKDDPKPGTHVASVPPTARTTCVTVTYKTPAGPRDCKSTDDICKAGAPWYTSAIDSLCGAPVAIQTVRLLAQPTTGGDPGSSFCIAWTGSRDGVGRDGVLLMNASGYECGADVVDPQTGLAFNPAGSTRFSNTPQSCADTYPLTRLTYPAVLDYSRLTPDEPAMFVCLTEHAGA
ncbi:hypothetical protein ACGFRG_09015 [Streptomyces sp. NPDC048696]|uniref:hypothetical protein n=1 Tax=Streptomyces sp. NPDC048696 TaxID=3365585 RepID=UPI0037100989